jgi:hypothetical protein
MKLITNIEQLKGKTIDDILDYDMSILIKFTDGSGCKIITEELESDYYVLALGHYIYSDQERIFLGMITQEQIDERNKKQEERNNHFKLTQQYQQYQQLKALFEGKTFQEIKEGN